MNTSSHDYLFTSSRLGFRQWSDEDLEEFAALNADTEVMSHFPKTLSPMESEQLIYRLKKMYDEYGYCYFATDVLDSSEFIGFIGLAYQDYKAPFAPCTDIGWRLKKSAWGQGYATEGARRNLSYAFEELSLKSIIATCTKENSRSENVMKKIGMSRKGEFDHPELDKFPRIERCIWYEIVRLGKSNDTQPI